MGDGATGLRRLQRLRLSAVPPLRDPAISRVVDVEHSRWVSLLRLWAVWTYPEHSRTRYNAWNAPVAAEWLTIVPDHGLERWKKFLVQDIGIERHAVDEFMFLLQGRSELELRRLCHLEALRIISQLINDKHWWDDRCHRDWSEWLSAASREAVYAVLHREQWERGPQVDVHSHVVREQIYKGFKGSYDGKGNWKPYQNIYNGKGMNKSKWR